MIKFNKVQRKLNLQTLRTSDMRITLKSIKGLEINLFKFSDRILTNKRVISHDTKLNAHEKNFLCWLIGNCCGEQIEVNRSLLRALLCEEIVDAELFFKKLYMILDILGKIKENLKEDQMIKLKVICFKIRNIKELLYSTIRNDDSNNSN